MTRGLLVSWTRNLATACDEREFWPLWVDELWNAALEGSSKSVSAMVHGSHISRWRSGLWLMAGAGASPLALMNP
jgi:hypothetical protein